LKGFWKKPESKFRKKSSMQYFMKIFGCQMNYSDAERISTILEKLGLEPAFKNEADSPAKALASAGLIIFVTCGVRQTAEDRVYGQIHNIRKKHPEKIIILTGCLAHRKDVQRRLKRKVNLFTTINDFPSDISKFISNSRFAIQNSSRHKIYNDYLKIKPDYAKPYTAYVPIMTGCDNFCAYCVVPYARGREYSRPAKDILYEVKNLIKKGYKEIILLGQNVNSYCDSKKNSSSEALVKEDPTIGFPKLLRLIEQIPGNFWLTFLTSHPKDMSDELIETIAKAKKVCEYISLPAQSGDNEILRRMNRKYTIEHYKKLIKKVINVYKKYKPGISPCISTDIIVGFPGETKKQFENTAKFLKELKFDMAYISQYSPRPETAAWKLKDTVSKKEKARREKVLTDILAKTALANNKKYFGKVFEVLIDKKLGFEEFRRAKAAEGKSRALDKHKYLAHTRTQKKVLFSSNKKIPICLAPHHHAKRDWCLGSFVKVKITKAKAFGLVGIAI